VGVLILIAYSVLASYIFESTIIAMIFELITGISVVGMAVLMFPILKPHNKNLTFGYTVVKTIDGVLLIVAAFILLSPSTLLLEVRDWIHAAYLFGIGFLLLSYLFYQSKLVPRFISVWGTIASAVLLVATLVNMMAGSIVIQFIFSHFPVVLNELFLAAWLIVKGFNQSVVASKAAKTDTESGVF
jgi:hypothetical protein